MLQECSYFNDVRVKDALKNVDFAVHVALLILVGDFALINDFHRDLQRKKDVKQA